MKIKMKLGDGSVTEVDAFWHPTRQMGSIATGGTWIRREGLWTTDTIVQEHLVKVNDMRRGECIPERDLSDMDALFQGIKCAEAPLEIYSAGDSEQPWTCTGNLIKEVPAGEVEPD